MTKVQQMQVKKMHEQQGIKLVMKQTSADARIAALEAQLRISSQPKEEESNVRKKKGETSEEPAWGETEGIL